MAAQVCVACHGQDGVGITPQYPSLAGQHEDYIERALHDYKKGGRKNPIMATFAWQIKDADISVIAEYYAKRKPALETEARPSTILTAGSELERSRVTIRGSLIASPEALRSAARLRALPS